MADPSDDHAVPCQDSPGEPASLAGRPWLGVLFDCCDVYYRIYRNEEGTAYEGRCPRCGGRLRIGVGPDGVEARFFRAE